MREGAGDPVVLAELGRLRSSGALRPARYTIGTSGDSALFATRGQDVQGLLLGVRNDWYVFAVGVVDTTLRAWRLRDRDASIEDIRAIGFRGQGGEFSWVVGPANPESVELYRQTYSPDQRAIAAAGRHSLAKFPHDLDDFRLKAGAGSMVVEETGSGATWQLPLPANSHDRSPAEHDEHSPSRGPLIVSQ